MTFVFMLIGALLGAWLCGELFDERTGWTGALFGLLAGIAFAQLQKLRARLAQIERELNSLKVANLVRQTRSIAPAPDKPDAVIETVAPAAANAKPLTPVPASASVEQRMESASEPVVAAPAPTPLFPSPPPAPRKPDAYDKIIAGIKAWFTQGNVPVKVGIVVSFFGVGALLKYAADSGWLRVPVQFRLLGIAAVALGALIFAWRKREAQRTFALSLQGGAIGVLILTIFGAYRLYGLLPSTLAFALLVVVVAGAALLAVLQDALALAVLASAGGFLAPILTSSGQGSHVALFSYYAVLNAAIFVIAWIKPWRVLNLLGFAFTFGVGTLWGALQYKPEFFATTEPFLILFFAFYLLVPLAYALRQAPQRRELIDTTLVFGAPLVALPLQAVLLDGARLPIALSAVAAAAVYVPLAWLELRRWRLTMLGQAHALLALGLATLAIPLAFSARSTACLWAVEGAAVLWVGLRQNRRLPRWIGYGLQALAGMAFAYSAQEARELGIVANQVILNGNFLGAVLIAVAGLASARLLQLRGASPLATILFLWGWLWWLAACNHEIEHFVTYRLRADAWLAVMAVSGALGAAAFRFAAWREAAWPALAAFALAPLFAFATAIGNHGTLEGWGAAAWALWLVAALRMLIDLTVASYPWRHLAHALYLSSIALVLGVEFAHAADAHAQLNGLWIVLAGFAPLGALFWLIMVRAGLVRWPDPDSAERGRRAMLIGLAGVLCLAWIAGLFVPGEPAPLPYLPLVNPLELAQLGLLVLLLAWYRRAADEGDARIDAEVRARALALAGFALLTAITLRSAHFLGAVPWDFALWQSPLAQAALSIVWTLAGIGAMLLGKRRGSRAVWLGGALLMGVVIAKLLIVDRTHLQDIAAIVGVLVVGVLLVAVGYFAPAPPRKAGENA